MNEFEAVSTEELTKVEGGDVEGALVGIAGLLIGGAASIPIMIGVAAGVAAVKAARS
jgi:hypothetical protein